MLDLVVISLFFSMVLAPCVVASVSSKLEGKTFKTLKTVGLVRKPGKPSGEVKT